MNDTKEFINSIEKIKDFLHAQTKEEKEDVQESIKYLKKRVREMNNLISSQKSVKKSELIDYYIAYLNLYISSMELKLKDLKSLINKTIDIKS